MMKIDSKDDCFPGGANPDHLQFPSSFAIRLWRFRFRKFVQPMTISAVEVNCRAFRDRGELHPSGQTYSVAQSYANMNNDYLSKLNIHPSVTGIQVNDGNDTVYVAVSAELSALFPSVVPDLLVTETGTAQVRKFQK
jgi:hypothetical protein